MRAILVTELRAVVLGLHARRVELREGHSYPPTQIEINSSVVWACCARMEIYKAPSCLIRHPVIGKPLWKCPQFTTNTGWSQCSAVSQKQASPNMLDINLQHVSCMLVFEIWPEITISLQNLTCVVIIRPSSGHACKKWTVRGHYSSLLPRKLITTWKIGKANSGLVGEHANTSAAECAIALDYAL